MKCFLNFLSGIVCAILFLIAYHVITSQYESYVLQSQTSQWLSNVKLLQAAIENKLIARNDSAEADINGTKQIFLQSAELIDTLVVTDAGLVIMRGGNIGQVVVLIPSLEGERVSWRCKGGPDYAIPKICDGGTFHRE
jgi:hypothetical protein